MTASALTDRIHGLAAPLAEALGLEIWGLDLLYGPRLVIRLYVDIPLDLERPAEAVSNEPEDAPALSERVFSDGVSPEGVSIDQCARLSRGLGLALEVEDIVPAAYVLEISSPGLERPFFRLEQLLPYIGRRIAFSLAAPLEICPGRKNFAGALERVADTFFVVTMDDAPPFSKEAPGQVHVPWDLVKKAHLIHVFPDELKAKPKAGAKKAAREAAPKMSPGATKNASGCREGGKKHAQPAKGDGG